MSTMDGLLFTVLVAAVAIGFFLGRRSRRGQAPTVHAAAHDRYLEGLRHLLNEQPDAAIDALVTELDINQDTVEMYFALGALWRRKGEMDRAIRVHQALLSNSALTPQQMQQAQLELALDYTHSGLLDRSEVLLRELASAASPAIQQAAGRELVLVYQAGQDWEKAIAAVDELCNKLAPPDKPSWRHFQAHYCCELAERLLDGVDWNRSDLSINGIQPPPDKVRPFNMWLQRALNSSPGHPRALLLLSLLAIGGGGQHSARAALQSIQLEPGFAMVAVPLILKAVGCEEGVWQKVEDLYQKSREVGLIPHLVELRYRASSAQAARDFLIQELQRQEGYQSLAHLLSVVGASLAYEPLRSVLHEVLPLRFVCDHCGFYGRQFYWSCPSCKTWL